MTDLICRKSMMRCQTPGMCSPHGGCQPSAHIETSVRYSANSGASMTGYTELKRLAEAAQYENHEFQQSLVVATKKFFEGCIPEQILELIAERDQLNAEVEALRDKADCVDDCAHLIRKLVHCRRQLATDGTLAEKALDYLKRKGLQGSPLRGEAGHD